MIKYLGFFLFLSFWSFQAEAEDLQVYFSPSSKCENSIVKLINQSEESISAAVYAINNDAIVEALKKAHDRNVNIRILTDRLQASNRSSKVRELYDYGINIRVHSKFKIEHNKFAVYDEKSLPAVLTTGRIRPVTKTAKTAFSSLKTKMPLSAI